MFLALQFLQKTNSTRRLYRNEESSRQTAHHKRQQPEPPAGPKYDPPEAATVACSAIQRWDILDGSQVKITTVDLEKSKNASSGNRIRGPTMATLDFTTKPMMLVIWMIYMRIKFKSLNKINNKGPISFTTVWYYR
jgi:hypothetical protein